VIDTDHLDIVNIPKVKKDGVIIAFFSTIDEENMKVCQLIKYLRIKGGLQFPLIFCSFLRCDLLQNQWDILTYGEKSHRYHPIPMDIRTFIKTISSAVPMSDGNYTLFCKEYSGKHGEFYKNKILPLLNKANVNDVKWLERFELLIEEMISNTPLTCHKRIKFQGIEDPLANHLREAFKQLSHSKTLHENELTKIKKLLDRWFQLVINETFE